MKRPKIDDYEIKGYATSLAGERPLNLIEYYKALEKYADWLEESYGSDVLVYEQQIKELKDKIENALRFKLAANIKQALK